MTVLNKSDKLQLGSSLVSSVYLGVTKVWPSWTPAALPGLAVWLDASRLSDVAGSSLDSWPNLGANGISVMAGTPLPKISTNTLNGRKLVRLTVSEGRVRVSNTTCFLNYTAIIVCRIVPGGAIGRLLTTNYPGDQGNNNWLVGPHPSGYDWFYDNGNVSNAVPWNANGYTWKLYVADSIPTEQNLYSNGVLLGTRINGSAIGPGGRLNLSGYGPYTEETCDGEVAEVIQYNRRISVSERQMVESYLRDKWGL